MPKTNIIRVVALLPGGRLAVGNSRSLSIFIVDVPGSALRLSGAWAPPPPPADPEHIDYRFFHDEYV